MVATILYLAESFPFVLSSGYQLRVAATILTLSQQTHVHILSYHPTALSQQTAHTLVQKFAATLSVNQRKLFIKNVTWTIIVEPKIDVPIQQRWAEWWHSWLTNQPFLLWQYPDSTYKKTLQILLEKFKPIAVHFSHLRLLKFLPIATTQQPKPKCVYEAVNVEWQLTQTFADYLPKLGRWHWWWRREQWLVKKFESIVVNQVDLILAISSQDEQDLRALGAKKVVLLPIMYPPDGQTKPPAIPKVTQTPQLFFVGNLDWLPNTDAISYFLREVWPKVAAQHHTVTMAIVGAPCSYKSLTPTNAPNRVKFLGFVDDISAVMAESQITVLPFRMGGGIRLKALTAAWQGHAIVSTPLGLQGLELQNSVSCKICNSATEMSKVLLDLLQTPTKITQLGKAAQKSVSQHHGPASGKTAWHRYWTTVGVTHSKT
jgi:hypothetical protein